MQLLFEYYAFVASSKIKRKKFLLLTNTCELVFAVLMTPRLADSGCSAYLRYSADFRAQFEDLRGRKGEQPKG